jgi:hypothetical protein
MDYTAWKFLYPPRAEHVVTSDMLPMYEQRGWVYQYKKNGTSTTITIDPDGNVRFMTRHGDVHRAWVCPTWLQVALLQYVPAKRWTMLVAELMHSKTPTIKDTLYIYDVIVYQSQHLIGYTLNERLKILDGVFPRTEDEADVVNINWQRSHWVIQNGIWLAKTFTQGASEAFHGIKNPKIDEGLVVKDPKSKLKWCNKATANEAWQVKVRYPTKNFQF